MSQPGYWAVVPAEVRYHKGLCANAKLLYAEITSLQNSTGVCWAPNSYFSELYGVDNKTISRWISQLRDCHFIDVVLQKSEGNKRQITIHNNVHTYGQNNHYLSTKMSIPMDKNVTSIYENNKINNKTNREGALAFFEDNFPSAFERLMMQFKKQISDFVMFAQMFDATVQQENLVYEQHVLEGRFKKYALQWIKNQSRDVKKLEVSNQPQNTGPVGQAI